LNNIHATLVNFNGVGILLKGKSGSGKSDLALRMIIEKGAKLVADDRVILSMENNVLYGEAPNNIAGKLEVRGIGIQDFDYIKKSKIDLCLELSASRDEIERLPYDDFINFLGISITKIKIYPFDCSTICKIIVKTSSIIS
jgi:serine kinase of HPr protein (carbohydrate metabolism regulator)